LVKDILTVTTLIGNAHSSFQKVHFILNIGLNNPLSLAPPFDLVASSSPAKTRVPGEDFGDGSALKICGLLGHTSVQSGFQGGIQWLAGRMSREINASARTKILLQSNALCAAEQKPRRIK
jgi:hypothetical protein